MDKKLTLGSEGQKQFGGVCAGLANYFEIDVALVRVLTAMLILGTSGSGLFLYGIFYLAMPYPKGE